MVRQKLEDFLVSEGYTRIPSNLPEFTIYFHIENNYVNVLHIIDYKEGLYISQDQYEHLKEKITLLFTEKGFTTIHILSLIVSSDIEKSKRLGSQDSFCWILDPIEKKLVIYENQVNEFYGLKTLFENWLENIESKPIENKKPENVEKKKDIPYITVIFVAINVFIFLLCAFGGDFLYNIGTFSVTDVLVKKEYYRFVSSIFIHWSIDHLVSNMLILYYMGETVEKYFGHFRYAAAFLVSGIFGNLLSMSYEIYTESYARSAGASGAIFGIIGIMLFLVIIHRGKFKQITIGRMLFMIFYSLYSGFIGTDINNAAHIGGFLSGVGCGFILWLLKKPEKNKEKRKRE